MNTGNWYDLDSLQYYGESKYLDSRGQENTIAYARTSAMSYAFLRLVKDELVRFEEGGMPNYEKRRAVLNKWWESDYRGWRSAAIAELCDLRAFTQGPK